MLLLLLFLLFLLTHTKWGKINQSILFTTQNKTEKKQNARKTINQKVTRFKFRIMKKRGLK